MAGRIVPPSPRSSFRIVLAMLVMVGLPAALTLRTVRFAAVVSQASPDPTPYGYTISLLLFIIPALVIGLWFVPQEGIRISRRAFGITIGLLFPLGALMDFFFANTFFTFGNAAATLEVTAPALGGGVPVEEYVFYLMGFVADLLLYIWFDEYWLAAYGISNNARRRTDFDRLLRFHPASAVWGVVLLVGAFTYRQVFVAAPGFPGYFLFIVLTALLPSCALLPMAIPVINWRAFSLTLFIMLLTSMLWEATLGVPYRWWGFQPSQMIGLKITAWAGLPIEEVFVWITVTYVTVITYEIVRRWQSSGKVARHAFFGEPATVPVQTVRAAAEEEMPETVAANGAARATATADASQAEYQ